MGRECSAHWRREECTEGFSGKAKGKKPLGNLDVGLEDHIKMDFTEIGGGFCLGIYLAQDRDQ
jgi:hypothetical protein